MELVKHCLTRFGACLTSKAIYNLNAVVNYLEVGRWMKAHGFTVSYFENRERLFETMAQQIQDQRALYLEFGVYEGAAMRYWSRLLRNPDSHLHGFDSFEGLPEPWLLHRPKGHFSLNGHIPQIDDVRVRFFKGWFEDTLPHYRAPEHDALILNFDADLYSSTRFVLRQVKELIKPGTVIYFDEFNHRDHEMKAFDEFLDETGMKFSCVGATPSLARIAFVAY